MVSIMPEIHTILIKGYIFPNKNKCAHNRLLESLVRNEGIISIVSMLAGGDWKVMILMVV